MVLWDRYGRPLLNLRFVVTLACNFKCFFCHREGLTHAPRKEKEIMKPIDYLLFSEAARRIGIKSYKLTGGEPLVRHDILDVVKALYEGNPDAEISITTNGYFLARYASKLAEYGVKRVNVSLHSLNPATFEKITGVDGLENVLKGLEAARDAGLAIKINFVALRGLNTDEIGSMLELARRLDAKLQIIELHPVGEARHVFGEYHVPYKDVLALLLPHARRIKYRSDLHHRAIIETWEGVEVEVVGPVGNPVFCAGCTRVRVSPWGELTPCLNRGDIRVDALSYARRARSWEEAIEAIISAFRIVNQLREPYFKYRLDTPPVPRRLRSYRIYVPKRYGGIDPRIEKKLLMEWSSDWDD